MSIEPLPTTTTPADERWNETLDALAQAVVRDMAERGLFRDDAEEAARYHVRSFGRRLVNPLLDRVRLELQAGLREADELRGEVARLRARVAGGERTRRRALGLGVVLGVVWALLFVAATWLVLMAV